MLIKQVLAQPLAKRLVQSRYHQIRLLAASAVAFQGHEAIPAFHWPVFCFNMLYAIAGNDGSALPQQSFVEEQVLLPDRVAFDPCAGVAKEGWNSQDQPGPKNKGGGQRYDTREGERKAGNAGGQPETGSGDKHHAGVGRIEFSPVDVMNAGQLISRKRIVAEQGYCSIIRCGLIGSGGSIVGTRRCLQVVMVILGMARIGSVDAGGVIARQQWQDYDWPVPDTQNAQRVTRSLTALDWVAGELPGEPAFHYDYQPLRIRSGEPAHNGHLHRLSVGVEGTLEKWRLEARLGLHGTSNIFKYWEPHEEAVVGKVTLWRELDNTHLTALGVGGDHRFGHFRWLPRFLWEQSIGGHYLRLDLPQGLYWEGPHKHWRLRAERVGDKWGALNAERDFRSAIYLEEWQLVLSRRFPAFAGGWFLELGLGVSLDTRVRYREADRRQVRRDFGNSGFGLVQLRW